MWKERNWSVWPTDRRVVLCLALLAALTWSAAGASADQTLRIDRRSQWQTWSFPRGAVELREDGAVSLHQYQRGCNPLALAVGPSGNAATLGNQVRAGSRPENAHLVIDGDEHTWWQPDPEDDLRSWEVEVDLGRIVLLEKIRLVFPDTAGARPFEDFSVYTSEGATISGTKGMRRLVLVATTTAPNRDRVLEYSVGMEDYGDGAEGEYLYRAAELPFRPVQYVRFVPHKQTPRAALAEVVLQSLGQNLGLDTYHRGGNLRTAKRIDPTKDGLLDGTADGYWRAPSGSPDSDWHESGQWFEWDLGVAFFLDQIAVWAMDYDLGMGSSSRPPRGYAWWISDGTPASATTSAGERIRGNYDYHLLTRVDNTWYPLRCMLYHQFPPRKARYLFFHQEYGWTGFYLLEVFLYGEGYPAVAELQSDLIDFGAPRSLRELSWDAERPPGTGLEIRTRSGNTLSRRMLYYHRNGQAISKESWERLPSVARGQIDTVVYEGEDWSSWSDPYVGSREGFRSPTPRRYVRMKVALSSEDGMATPELRSLTVNYTDPLIYGGIMGEVRPREAEAGTWVELSYVLRPTFGPADRGLDRVLIAARPGAEALSVWVDGREIGNAVLETVEDTLDVTLPYPVRPDSLEVRFRARLLEYSTVLAGWVAHTSDPDVRQQVTPAHRDALTVYLPMVAAGDRVIANVAAEPAMLTPNGDGVNDEGVVSFDLLRTTSTPEVRIHDLSGRVVKKLPGVTGRRQRYEWDCTDQEGNRVAPGIYLCSIRVATHTGDHSTEKLFHVAY